MRHMDIETTLKYVRRFGCLGTAKILYASMPPQSANSAGLFWPFGDFETVPPSDATLNAD
jgi:hypothetical protein